jgi:hypothetical protein
MMVYVIGLQVFTVRVYVEVDSLNSVVPDLDMYILVHALCKHVNIL